MPPEALAENPTYNAAIDMFSFGHLALYTIVQDFPYPSPAVVMDPDNPGALVEPEIDAPEPEIDTLEPESDSPEPEIDTLEPKSDSTEPEIDALEPEIDTHEPESDSPQPRPDAPQPCSDARRKGSQSAAQIKMGCNRHSA